jgi:predicted O-methyltransferase YrrM
MAWVSRKDEPDDGVAFGTGAGYLTTWMLMTGEDGKGCRLLSYELSS